MTRRNAPDLLVRLRFGLPFWGVVLLVLAAFAFGGSSRPDVPGLLVLRPLAALLFVYALFTLSWPVVQQNRWLLTFALLVAALPAAQLVPLPPAVWTALPGRELNKEVLASLGLADSWQPLTMAPAATRNALYALLVPGAVLLLGVRLDARARHALVWVLLLAGAASGLVGLAQVANPDASDLYFYDITNSGEAVGLFANRNHQAMFLACLFLLLGYLAASIRRRAGLPLILSGLAGLALVPLILITGSRSGLVLGVIAVLLILPVMGRESLVRMGTNNGINRRGLWLALTCAGLILAGLTVYLGRAEAFDRVLEANAMEDMRVRILPVLWAMIRTYGLLGTGIGSFERVYQIHEPDDLLASFYMNHAHNDWLETLLTGGLVAACLALAVIYALLRRFYAVFGRSAGASVSMALARLGLAVLALIAAGSLTDYPLRTPAFSVIFVLAVLWATCPEGEHAPLPARANSVSV